MHELKAATEARLRELAASNQRRHRLPSLVVAVSKGGQLVDSVALGHADLNGPILAGTDVQYRIGSITKTLTAVAVMQLVSDGRLQLSDTLGSLWPDAPHGQLTVGALMRHSAGLQREPIGHIWETLEAPSYEELAATAEEARKLFPPDTWWHYSNLGFALLGGLVAHLSGASWESQVKQRILLPLQMARTTLTPEPPAAQGYSVLPYSDQVTPEVPIDIRGLAPAGQLWSTAEDLARWVSFLLRGHPDVLSGEMLELMRLPKNMLDLQQWTAGYGTGLMLLRGRTGIAVGHTGGIQGFLAAAFGSVASGTEVVILTNTTSGPLVTGMAVEILDLIAEDLADRSIWIPAEAPPADVEPILGSWWSEWSEWTFRWRDGELQSSPVSSPAGTGPERYRRLSSDLFVTVEGPERGEELQVIRDADGSVVKLYRSTYLFTRLPESASPDSQR